MSQQFLGVQVRTTLFLCPIERCNRRFKSTYGRTQHISAKHPNFGINDSEPKSQSDDLDTNTGSLGGHRPITSSPSSHTSQLDQADENMVIDSDTGTPPVLGLSGSDGFLQPPTTYSPFLSPPPFDDLPVPPSPFPQSPAIHSHDASLDPNDSDIELTGHSESDDTASADESATSASSFTDYHPMLNGKLIHSIPSALY